MNKTEINGIEVYNFPEQEQIGHMVFWMGRHYIEYITTSLLNNLSKQDPNTEMIAIKLEEDPSFETFSQQDGTITTINCSFNIQVLVKDGQKQDWLLKGLNRYSASNLPEAPKIMIEFEIITTEKA